MDFDSAENYCRGMNNATLIEIYSATDFVIAETDLLRRNDVADYWIGMKKYIHVHTSGVYQWLASLRLEARDLITWIPNSLSNNSDPTCVSLSYSSQSGHWMLKDRNCSEKLQFICQNQG